MYVCAEESYASIQDSSTDRSQLKMLLLLIDCCQCFQYIELIWYSKKFIQLCGLKFFVSCVWCGPTGGALETVKGSATTVANDHLKHRMWVE